MKQAINQLELQLHYPLGDTLPAPGTTLEVAPGVKWIRMSLPFALNHINLWLLRDEIEGQAGWSVVDCCISTDGAKAQCPPRHNSCRPNRTKNLGAAMKDRSWHDTDKHSRTGRLLGCCRLKARLWNWLPGRLALEQKHYSVGAMMFSPCPPEGGHGLRRRVCRL